MSRHFSPLLFFFSDKFYAGARRDVYAAACHAYGAAHDMTMFAHVTYAV